MWWHDIFVVVSVAIFIIALVLVVFWGLMLLGE